MVLSTDVDTTSRARAALISALIRRGELTTPAVIQAMKQVPRHLFVEPGLRSLAYADIALPTAAGQTISQPTIVAMMTEALALTGRERVLEIGTGSGYQAAVLSHLAREVLTIERLPELAIAAARRLEALGYTNVQVRTGDGSAGWPELAPFDRVIVTAASPHLPYKLLSQLSDGGILVAPVGPRSGQELVRILRFGDEVDVSVLDHVEFVPLIEGR